MRGDGQVESSGGMVLIGQMAAAGPPPAPARSSASLRSGVAEQSVALESSGSSVGALVETNVVLTVFEGNGTDACVRCVRVLIGAHGHRCVLNLFP